MKNIDAILKELEIEIDDDKREKLSAAVKENYKPVADWQKQVDKVNNLQETLADTQAALKEFDGVDADALKKQISDLEKQINDKETEYNTKLADRDFEDLIKTAITTAKGKNAKAIKALLDLDDLKASKNQKEDLDKAIKALAEAEDSKMLFGEPEPKKIGEGNLIGTVAKNTGIGSEVEKARAIMGLAPVNKQ